MTLPGDAIIELERLAAAHWRAPEEEHLGEWLLRAAGGFTGRANSALPLGDPGMPLDGALAAVTAWYRARDLPPMIAVPQPLQDAASPLEDHLTKRNWVTRPGPAFVMTARTTGVPPPSTPVHLAPEPDQAWCRLYRYRGNPLPPAARTLLLSAPWQSFATIRAADVCDAGAPATSAHARMPDDGARARADGAAVAVGRVSVAGGWAGITAVEVDPAWRRRGLATAITAALCMAAAQRGASRVFLQVETGNAPARALYARCGFRDSHRYHYRIAP